MDAKEREFKRLSRLDQSSLEKETGGDEEVGTEIPYISYAGEGAESVVDREPHAEVPAPERGYRRLDEPAK
ncbi:hypothetical protein D3C87_1006010 [compost metagenome]